MGYIAKIEVPTEVDVEAPEAFDVQLPDGRMAKNAVKTEDLNEDQATAIVDKFILSLADQADIDQDGLRMSVYLMLKRWDEG